MFVSINLSWFWGEPVLNRGNWPRSWRYHARPGLSAFPRWQQKKQQPGVKATNGVARCEPCDWWGHSYYLSPGKFLMPSRTIFLVGINSGNYLNVFERKIISINAHNRTIEHWLPIVVLSFRTSSLWSVLIHFYQSVFSNRFNFTAREKMRTLQIVLNVTITKESYDGYNWNGRLQRCVEKNIHIICNQKSKKH